MDTERLISRIMSRIDAERGNAERRALVRNAGIAVGAFAGFVVAAQATFSEMTLSGFSAYISLFFSDTRALLAHWNDVAWVLAETLPTVRAFTMFGFMLVALRATLRIRQAKILSSEFYNRELHGNR